MKNWEAFKAICEGKMVTHPSWNGKSFLSQINGGGRMTEHLLDHPDGWELYELGHDFAWACDELVSGRAVRRKGWNADQIIRCISQGDPAIVWTNTGTSFCLGVHQIKATDWVSAEVPK